MILSFLRAAGSQATLSSKASSATPIQWIPPPAVGVRAQTLPLRRRRRRRRRRRSCNLEVDFRPPSPRPRASDGGGGRKPFSMLYVAPRKKKRRQVFVRDFRRRRVLMEDAPGGKGRRKGGKGMMNFGIFAALLRRGRFGGEKGL